MSRRKRDDDSGDEIESGDEDAAPASDDDVADDGGEEEEDEEDEERRTARKKKKRRTGALNLIDEEAEEDDELDDEEDDDDYGGVKGLIHDGSDDEGAGAGRDSGREAMRAQRLRREQDMKGEDARDVVRRIEERWAAKTYDDVEDADGEPLDSAGVDQQGLQPTIRDPRVFVLRCRKPGYERRAILTLLQKMFDLKARGVDIGILSAIAPDHLKGFLYIEAFSVSQVEQAIRGLDLITSYGGIKPLLLDEMTDVLQVGKRLDKQEPGNWVRIQRGVYKGDLAQVYKVPEGGAENQVMVRMIPRLRFRREEGDDDEFDDEEDEEYVEYDADPSGALGKGVKGKKKIKRRAPQKLFDHRECSRLFCASGDDRSFTTRDQFSGEVFETWDGDLYRLGLLYKKVSLRTLLVNDAVVPTPDELEKWAAAETRIRLLAKDPETTNMVDARDLREGLLLKEAAVKSKRKTTIFKGDSVNIIQGEQAGMSGTVIGFDGGIVLIEDGKSRVEVRASRADVVKTFKLGDHVKVTSGKYAGHAGVLVVVDGDSMVMFTDSTCEEIKVTGQQVSDSNDLATEEQVSTAANGKQISLFEMVHPIHDRDAKGVIVGIHGERVSLLNEANIVSEFPMRDLRHVPKDAYTQAVDARGNKLSRNIALHVISGNLKDRTGIIVEVTGSTVFFKAADEVRNCGILAVPSQQCEAQAAAARTLGNAGGNKLPAAVPRGALPTLTGGAGGFLAAGRGRGMGRGGGAGRNRDVLKDRDVKVTSGPYKGHLGKVVDANEKTVRVELTSKMKVVTLTRNRVKDVSPDAKPEDSYASMGRGQSFSYQGQQASRHQGLNGFSQNAPQPGSRTPININFGGRTPLGAGSSVYGGVGSRTPASSGFGGMPGSRTPAHHGFGGGLVQPRTPAHSAFRPTTPARADDYSGFGSFGQAPSGGGSADPFASYNAPVPMTPGTPSMLPVTPGGGVSADPTMIPQTPVDAYNMPQTPQMEPQTPQIDSIEPQTPMPYGEVVSTPGGPMAVPVTPEPSTPMPHTPGPMDEPSTPAPDGDAAAAAAGAAQQQGYRVLIDVVVSLPDMGGRSAVVTNAAFDGMYVDVKLLDTGEEMQLTSRNFTPVQPAIEAGTENLVKVLDGEQAGQVGRLKSMEAQPDGAAHGQIEFLQGDVRVLDMAIVAKYQRAT